MEVLNGTEIVDGDIRLGHLFHEVDAIFEIIILYKIEWFVEIGVHEGGLTMLLLNRFPNLNYLGIDNNLSVVKASVREKVNCSKNACLIQEDCFEPNTIAEVKDWMPKDLPCLIHCDNGKKSKEVKCYAPLLRPGDILMTHDYHDGRRVVDALREYGYGTSFPAPEIFPEDVAFLYEICKELDKVDLSRTRLIGFIRL